MREHFKIASFLSLTHDYLNNFSCLLRRAKIFKKTKHGNSYSIVKIQYFQSNTAQINTHFLKKVVCSLKMEKLFQEEYMRKSGC